MNSAWTPAVRPAESSHLPAHARFGFGTVLTTADLLETAGPAVSAAAAAAAAEETVPLPRTPSRVTTDLAVVAYALPDESPETPPDTPPRGLRTFDLGTVPASVTPPRTWRKAAWFAVGTSAAVVCGLAVAAVRFVGTPAESRAIDGLPAFPTQQLDLDDLPARQTSAAPATSDRSSSESPTRSDVTRSTRGGPASHSAAEAGASTPGSSDASGSSDGTSPASPAEPARPERTTVGRAPVTPTNPAEMGDRTEKYFALVTENPAEAHELCTGGMAREGPEGIEARYAGMRRVEVQSITIDRNQATTTSMVKVVREDGTETVEERQLTFTWGGDPKISDDAQLS